MHNVEDALRVQGAPDLPGVRFRHYRGLEDIPAMSAVVGAVNEAAGSVQTESVEDMLANYRNLVNSDPGLDIVVVEADGLTVGYQRTWWSDRAEGSRGLGAVMFVHPAHAERGIEDGLLSIGLERQLAQAATMRAELPGRQIVLTRFARGSGDPHAVRLERAGFHLARRYAEMVRPDFEAIPAVPVPDGIALRRVDPADAPMHRLVWEVGVRAFADSWGEDVQTEVDWQKFVESPQTQPGLWCIATDAATGEVVGHILNYLGEPDDAGSQVGWTESIAVLAPYRRRGIASAMLAESLRIVRDAGAARAALGVDQQNPNEALTLYERLGFRVTIEELEYQRPFGATEPVR
jgi:ribosomal protein S18 acetylase RimI-like enzyme